MASPATPPKGKWNPMKCRREGPPTDRMVYANDPERNAAAGFVDNKITNTKYTPLTFVPKTLLEQFSRNMNRYFLMIACLQLIKEITPVNPLTTWVPLIVIFGITAVKELVDDLGRRKSDRQANSRKYSVVRGGRRSKMSAEGILVGDIVFLQENEEVPCDLVVISTSDEAGNCFIQTTNLDGESNLKPRAALAATKALNTDAAIGGFRGVVKCGPPDEKLYKFDSQLKLTPDASRVLSLSSDHMLLQATHLRNTDFVYGMAVYTGNETKFGNNKKTPPPKMTKTDKLIDKFSLYIFLFQLGLVVVFGTIGGVWKDQFGKDASYLGYEDDEPGYQWIVIPARFLLLNSTMIPISLKVTLDLCKLYYAKFIDRDTHLYDPATDTPAHSNSTALSEDLGQIEYILSDKTGTLTENVMVLKVSTVGGRQFGTHDANADTLLGTGSKADPYKQPGGVLGDLSLPPVLQTELAANTLNGALDFFRNMALNNSVVPAKAADGGQLYKASSPDEEALVKAAASYGVRLINREGMLVTVDVLGQVERYEVLQELEFNSDRKRMSVILRNRDTQALRLYIKGADDTVLPRLRSDQDTRRTVQQVDAYAESGLRTLVLGFKDLSEEEYRQWMAQFEAANAEMTNRQARKEECYNVLEVNFYLTGATAIEDKLQDGVPATIAKLTAAGLKFWMCTGDKFSTALTISQTCNLKPKDYLLVELHGEEKEDVGRSLAEGAARARKHKFLKPAVMTTSSSPGRVATHNLSKPPGMTVIIKGPTLEAALEHHHAALSELLLAATSVVCCRVTPKQKAELVKIVKDAGFMTLSIGDGGNDVSMIQEAHVGVGIRGKEGLQASRASDYTVVPFKSLTRLLLVHGRYSYYRTSLVAQYSFYKSFYFCFLQIGYGFVSGFAGVSLFNSLCVAAYNALLFVPVVFFFVDKDLPQDVAVRHPEAYAQTRLGTFINFRTMLWWFLRALVQAVITLSLGLSVAPGSENNEAYDALGLLIFNAYLTVQDLTMLAELRRVSVYNVVSVFGLHLVAVIAGIVMNGMTSFESLIDYYTFNVALDDPVFWMGNILLTFAALIPIQATKWYVKFFGAPPCLSQAGLVSKPLGVETMNPVKSARKSSLAESVVQRRGSRVFYRNPTHSPRPAGVGGAS